MLTGIQTQPPSVTPPVRVARQDLRNQRVETRPVLLRLLLKVRSEPAVYSKRNSICSNSLVGFLEPRGRRGGRSRFLLRKNPQDRDQAPHNPRIAGFSPDARESDAPSGAWKLTGEGDKARVNS